MRWSVVCGRAHHGRTVGQTASTAALTVAGGVTRTATGRAGHHTPRWFGGGGADAGGDLSAPPK
jgi:hypothetical protein